MDVTSEQETKVPPAPGTNPFDLKPTEEKITEETKPLLPSTASDSLGEKPSDPPAGNKKPAPLTPMWTGRFSVVKQKAYNLIMMLPRPDVTILFLMLVDLLAVIVLLVYDNTSGSVSITELFFYAVSVVATVLGVLYLCGTKTPKDMMKLFNRNKTLLSEYDELNVKHTEILQQQREEVEDQKRENNRLSSTVVTFRQENEGLKQNVDNLKSVTEYLAQKSVEQLEGIGEQIAELQGLNTEFSEQIKEVNTDIEIMETTIRQSEENTRLQMAAVQNMEEMNKRDERSFEKQKETTEQIKEFVRVADLKDDLAEIADVPVHQSSKDLVEEKVVDNKSEPQVVAENSEP